MWICIVSCETMTLCFVQTKCMTFPLILTPRCYFINRHSFAAFQLYTRYIIKFSGHVPSLPLLLMWRLERNEFWSPHIWIVNRIMCSDRVFVTSFSIHLSRGYGRREDFSLIYRQYWRDNYGEIEKHSGYNATLETMNATVNVTVHTVYATV